MPRLDDNKVPTTSGHSQNGKQREGINTQTTGQGKKLVSLQIYNLKKTVAERLPANQPATFNHAVAGGFFAKAEGSRGTPTYF